MKKWMSNYQIRRNTFFAIISIILGWSVFTFLIYPNVNLLKITMFSDGKFNMEPVIRTLSSKRVQIAIRNSFVLAFALTVSVNVLGIFEVLMLDYYKIRGRKWLNIAYHSPLICNGMVLVLAYYFILGNQGYITANLLKVFPNLDTYWFSGFWAVLIELTFSNTNNHIMFVRDALNEVDYQTIEAAQNMGVKGRRILTKIVLPTIKPSIFAASILTFIVGISAFATPQVLGGTKFETINPLVRAFSQTLNTRNYAAVLAIFLGIITILILIITNYIESKQNYRSVSKVKTELRRTEIQNPVLRVVLTILAHAAALVHTIPLIFVLIFSFMSAKNLYGGNINPRLFTLDNYQRVLNSTTGLKPILVSIIYSALAAIIVVFLMLFIARLITKYHNKWTAVLEMLLQIPWFLPSTLLALGLVMTFDMPNGLLFGGILTGTPYILLIGYIIIKTPYTLRMIKSACVNIDNSLEEAAKNMGASMISTFAKVILPIIWPTMLSVFLLIFIALLAEYNVSVFLFHPLYQPLGVALNAATGVGSTPDSQMLTFVYSTFTMIISTVIIFFVYGSKNSAMKKSD